MYEVSGSRQCEPLLISLSSEDGPVMVRRMEAHSHNKANTFLYRIKHMTITGPSYENDPLKSEGHPKNLLKKSATPRHRSLRAYAQQHRGKAGLKAGLGFLFYYSFGSFLFLFSFSRGEAQTG